MDQLKRIGLTWETVTVCQGLEEMEKNCCDPMLHNE